MSVTDILDSAQFVIDKEGQQTAVLLDLEAWEALRQLLEDLEDMAELEAAQQENEKTIAWEHVVAEYQATYLVTPDVQD